MPPALAEAMPQGLDANPVTLQAQRAAPQHVLVTRTFEDGCRHVLLRGRFELAMPLPHVVLRVRVCFCAQVLQSAGVPGVLRVAQRRAPSPACALRAALTRRLRSAS
jgi:hypothetical protein